MLPHLPDGFANQAIEAVEALGIKLDSTPSNAATLTLARKYKLSVYDSLYLKLAMRQQGSLTTLDKALMTAAKMENVVVVRIIQFQI